MDSLSFFNYKLHEIEIEIETKLNTADYRTVLQVSLTTKTKFTQKLFGN